LFHFAGPSVTKPKQHSVKTKPLKLEEPRKKEEPLKLYKLVMETFLPPSNFHKSLEYSMLPLGSHLKSSREPPGTVMS